MKKIENKKLFLYLIVFTFLIVSLSLIIIDGNHIREISAAETHTHCICGLNHEATFEHNISDEREWIGVNSFPESSGYYYLTTDLIVSESCVVNGEIYLCLNGHSIISNTFSISVIEIREDAKLVLTDCNDYPGSISGGEGKTVANTCYGGGVYNAGTFIMYNGIISNNKSGNTPLNGSAVYNKANSVFTMLGGEITNNKNTSLGTGTAIYNEGELNLFGGSIYNNDAGENFNYTIDNYGDLSIGGNFEIYANGDIDFALEEDTVIDFSKYEYTNDSIINLYIANDERLAKASQGEKVVFTTPSQNNYGELIYFASNIQDSIGVHTFKNQDGLYLSCVCELKHDFEFGINSDKKTIVARCKGSDGECTIDGCPYQAIDSVTSLSLITKNISITQIENIDVYSIEANGDWYNLFGQVIGEYSVNGETWLPGFPNEIGTYKIRVMPIHGNEELMLIGSATILCDNHILNGVDGKPATCSETGLNYCFRCDTCGASFREYDVDTLIEDYEVWKITDGIIPLAEHTFVFESLNGTMTVRCENEECVHHGGVSAHIVCESKTYDGDAYEDFYLENQTAIEELLGSTFNYELYKDGWLIYTILDAGDFEIKYYISYKDSIYEVSEYLTVFKRPLYVTLAVTDKEYDGTDYCLVTGVNYENYVGALGSYVDINAKFLSVDVGDDIEVEIKDINLIGTDHVNYEVEIVNDVLKGNISKAMYDISYVTFNDSYFTIDDGLDHSIYVENLPVGIDGSVPKVIYTGNNPTEIGTHKVVATFVSESSNYDVPTPIEATIYLYGKALETYTTPTPSDQNGLRVGIDSENGFSNDAVFTVTTIAQNGSKDFDKVVKDELGYKFFSYVAFKLAIEDGTNDYKNGRYSINLELPSFIKNKDGASFSIVSISGDSNLLINDLEVGDGFVFFEIEGLDEVVIGFEVDNEIIQTLELVSKYEDILDSDSFFINSELERISSKDYDLSCLRYANDEAKNEGYLSYDGMLKDMLCKIAFDKAKEAAKSEVANSAHKHTGDNVRNAIVSKTISFDNEVVYQRNYSASGTITIEEMIEETTVVIEKRLVETKEDINVIQYIDIKSKDLSSEEVDKLLEVVNVNGLNLSEKMDMVDTMYEELQVTTTPLSLACKISFLVVFGVFGVSLTSYIVYSNIKLKRKEELSIE